jgi:DNA-binding LacI/PurR family transcriptional regulator
MRKHEKLAALLEERIARGDYALVGFPGVREVAAESGVAIMTAHRAMQLLIRKGVVTRRVRGRGKAGARRRATKSFTIGIIMPPSLTGFVWAWHGELEAAALACGATLREVVCRHWTDALIAETLRGFDGVFVLQFPADLPVHTRELITMAGTPLVSLDQDLSALGISSILAFPPGCCRTLLEHFYQLGHRRIGCLNTFPIISDIPLRLAEWQAWMAEKKLAGTLMNRPAANIDRLQNYAHRAHDLVVELVKGGRLDATALICPTVWTALGVMRGLQECGLRVGRDISVGVVNDEGMSQLVYPTLTAIQMPDVTAQLTQCVKWMMRGGPWKGAPLMTPSANQLFVGQSSGPAPRTSREKLQES